MGFKSCIDPAFYRSMVLLYQTIRLKYALDDLSSCAVDQSVVSADGSLYACPDGGYQAKLQTRSSTTGWAQWTQSNEIFFFTKAPTHKPFFFFFFSVPFDNP